MKVNNKYKMVLIWVPENGPNRTFLISTHLDDMLDQIRNWDAHRISEMFVRDLKYPIQYSDCHVTEITEEELIVHE